MLQASVVVVVENGLYTTETWLSSNLPCDCSMLAIGLIGGKRPIRLPVFLPKATHRRQVHNQLNVAMSCTLYMTGPHMADHVGLALSCRPKENL